MDSDYGSLKRKVYTSQTLMLLALSLPYRHFAATKKHWHYTKIKVCNDHGTGAIRTKVPSYPAGT